MGFLCTDAHDTPVLVAIAVPVPVGLEEALDQANVATIVALAALLLLAPAQALLLLTALLATALLCQLLAATHLHLLLALELLALAHQSVFLVALVHGVTLKSGHIVRIVLSIVIVIVSHPIVLFPVISLEVVIIAVIVVVADR